MELSNYQEYANHKMHKEEEEAVKEMPYRIKAGKCLLDESLHGRWTAFVTEKTYQSRGLFLNETLIIMGMIKGGVPLEQIRETISMISSHGTIIDYLSEFYTTEIINELQVNKDTQLEEYDR